jgi:hypothetical protein
MEPTTTTTFNIIDNTNNDINTSKPIEKIDHYKETAKEIVNELVSITTTNQNHENTNNDAWICENDPFCIWQLKSKDRNKKFKLIKKNENRQPQATFNNNNKICKCGNCEMNYIKWNPTPKTTEDNEPGPYIFNSTSDVKTPSLQYVNYNNNNINNINIFSNNNNSDNDINKQILNDYCDLNYKSHIIFYINPKSKLVNKINWAKELSNNFSSINYFGTNTEISFKIKYEYYQIYIDVPPQIASSKDWNKQAKSLWQMAEIYNNNNKTNNTIIQQLIHYLEYENGRENNGEKFHFIFLDNDHII